jgi:membrane protease YdiL (CAAX protease family)
MSDPQQPWSVEPAGPASPEEPQPPAAPPTARYPFWSYSDLLLFVGIAPVCLILGFAIVRAFLWALRIQPSARVAQLLPEQLLGYLLLFGALKLIFRAWYGQPLFASLAWNPIRLPAVVIVGCGMAAAVIVAFASSLVRLPNTPNPMTELMDSRTAVLLMAIFGVTVAPVCEELAFRGFLQPLLVRSLGSIPGILLAAIPFGLLHFQEYGNSWRHVLLISLAGAAFGLMRHVTGSTKAAALMHASYNALFFFALFSDRKDLPQTW